MMFRFEDEKLILTRGAPENMFWPCKSVYVSKITSAFHFCNWENYPLLQLSRTKDG